MPHSKNYVLLSDFSKNVVTVDECLMAMLGYFLKTLDLWQDSAIFTSSREFVSQIWRDDKDTHKVKYSLGLLKREACKMCVMNS